MRGDRYYTVVAVHPKDRNTSNIKIKDRTYYEIPTGGQIHQRYRLACLELSFCKELILRDEVEWGMSNCSCCCKHLWFF